MVRSVVSALSLPETCGYRAWVCYKWQCSRGCDGSLLVGNVVGVLSLLGACIWQSDNAVCLWWHLIVV